jgi:hypothetical protein
VSSSTATTTLLLSIVRERKFTAGAETSGTDIALDVSSSLPTFKFLSLININSTSAAAFLEFHEPIAAFLFPRLQRDDDDTLLTSNEVYHNFVKVDVTVRHIGSVV